MADITLKKKRLVLLASAAPDKCTNAVFLLCAYMLLTHNQLPEQAYRPILEREQTLPLAQFRDAGYGPATYWLTVPDLLVALQKGVKEAKLIDWDHFDIEQYEFFEKVENGDLNWVSMG